MFHLRSRWMFSCLLAVSLSYFTLSPDALAAQGVHEGKWKVTTAIPLLPIYTNATGAAHNVVVTVCVSGGEATFLTPGYAIGLAAPLCVSATSTLITGGQARVQLNGGSSASGTYQVTVNP